MNTAEQLILDMGQRPTSIRTAVLKVLMEADGALAHADVLERLMPIGTFDRVSVYRALDWLVEHGLAHTIAGTGRALRYHITHNNTMHKHAHFQCSECGKSFCLPDIEPDLAKRLPSDFSIESIDLNIKGTCGNCVRSLKN